jgi:hypothetical protein
MSERSLRGPDERWEAVSKNNTRDTSGLDKNKQKPDDVKAKGEITSHVEDEADGEEDED